MTSAADKTLSRLALRYERALLSVERKSAIESAHEALELTRDPAQVYVGVIQPAMRRIGKLWELGELTIADEHVATAISGEVVALIAPRAVEARSAGRAILSAVEGETHVVGLRMIGYLLEGRGYTVEFVGAGVPIRDLLTIVRRRQPSLVGLSITSEQNAPALDATLQALADSEASVLVGGQGVPPALRGDRAPYIPDALALPI